jgi:hypothetical protein
MKPEFENIPLVKNETKKRFEIEVNGHLLLSIMEKENIRSRLSTQKRNRNSGTRRSSCCRKDITTHQR